MPPSILVAGSTGNTGPGVVETLSYLMKSNIHHLSDYRILATTRSPDSPAAQKLAQLPGVEVIEQSWVEITSEWLHEHEVKRAFIASHLEQTQFAQESSFHLAALNAGVEYVVRVSTAPNAVRPDTKIYYGRQHWAIEALLSSPEFANFNWTSLRPNAFANFWLTPAAEFIKAYRKTGKQVPFKTMAAKHAPVGIIDPYDIGVFAAHLLVQEDPTAHKRAKYRLSGPQNVTGEQIVQLIEQYIGVPVKDITYKDLSAFDWLYETKYASAGHSRNIFLSAKHAPESLWNGNSTAVSSKEVLDLAPATRTPADVLKNLLEIS